MNGSRLAEREGFEQRADPQNVEKKRGQATPFNSVVKSVVKDVPETRLQILFDLLSRLVAKQVSLSVLQSEQPFCPEVLYSERTFCTSGSLHLSC